MHECGIEESLVEFLPKTQLCGTDWPLTEAAYRYVRRVRSNDRLIDNRIKAPSLVALKR